MFYSCKCWARGLAISGHRIFHSFFIATKPVMLPEQGSADVPEDFPLVKHNHQQFSDDQLPGMILFGGFLKWGLPLNHPLIDGLSPFQ